MIEEPNTRKSYKKRICLDFEPVIEQDLDLALDEYVILTWAYDFAESGHNKSIMENGQKYFWLKAQKCRRDLPILKIKTDRGVQMKFTKLVQKSLLIPFHNRKGMGAYYCFSTDVKKLFKNHRTLSTKTTLLWDKEELFAAFGEISKERRILLSDIEELFYHVVENLIQRRILPSDIEELFVLTSKSSSNNNIVNHNHVINNTQVFSKENFNFLEKLKIRNQELETEKENFETKIKELEKENEELKHQLQQLQASSAPVSKQKVFEIFKNTGCGPDADIFYKENKELIEAGLMTQVTIVRKAKEIYLSSKNQKPPASSKQPTSNLTYKLAQQTYEVFGVNATKAELESLVGQILRIQQERDLSLDAMRQNLQTYQQFVQTSGVTTNYSLKNWLLGDGNGFGKDWGKSLKKAQQNYQSNLSKEKGTEATHLDYSNYKSSHPPEFYPDTFQSRNTHYPPKTNSNT